MTLLKTTKHLWFPISELDSSDLGKPIMVHSPTLINSISNPDGITLGWVNLEHHTVLTSIWNSTTPELGTLYLSLDDVTHFILLEGPVNPCT